MTITVRSTRHGPILNDVDDRLKDQDPIALQWTSINQPDGAFTSILHLNTAASFADFRNALRGYGSPSQNFVYADVDGHIGYQFPGLVPIRAGERTGDRVRDGASGTPGVDRLHPVRRPPLAVRPAKRLHRHRQQRCRRRKLPVLRRRRLGPRLSGPADHRPPDSEGRHR